MEQDREGGREGGTEEKEDPRRREAASKSRAAGWSPVKGEEKKNRGRCGRFIKRLFNLVEQWRPRDITPPAPALLRS